MKLVKGDGVEESSTPKFRLLEDRVALVPDPDSDVLPSGLIVPESGKEVVRYGTVYAAGEGFRSSTTGQCAPLSFKVGDRVFWSRASGGSSITLGDQELLFLSAREVVGVIEE